LTYLAEEQLRRGHDVHIAYLYPGSQPELLISNPLACHRLRALGNYDPRILLQLYRFARSLRADVIQSWVVQMDVLAGLVAAWTGIPWVLREPASVDHYVGLKAKLRSTLASRAAAIVANSSAGSEYWKGRLPAPQISVIDNGVPLRRIREVPPRNWPDPDRDSPPFVLFAGRLEPQKNVEALLQALAIAIPHTQLYAVCCGDGYLRPALERRARDLGISANIVFLGDQSAETVWGLMKSAKALALLSWFEGFPNVVLEAMTCECPLLVSDIPAHRSVVSDSEATLVDPADVGSIAHAMRAMLANPDDTRRRTESARRRVEMYSLPRMADAYDEVYRAVVARRQHYEGSTYGS
jgi:glycosyltransferase involved in cell wall biosynthesis